MCDRGSSPWNTNLSFSAAWMPRNRTDVVDEMPSPCLKFGLSTSSEMLGSFESPIQIDCAHPDPESSTNVTAATLDARLRRLDLFILPLLVKLVFLGLHPVSEAAAKDSRLSFE